MRDKWLEFLKSINKVSLLLTLFLIPMCIAGIYVNLFKEDLVNVITFCIVLVVAIDSNKKL